MPDEAAQYHTLRRLFLRRFTEHEFLASGGDVRELLANVFAVLAAFGICISLILFRKYVFGLSKVPQAVRDAVMWSDYEFLMSMTIAVAGIVVIVCWDAFFPDRTDCLVLAALPVSMRAVLAAKLTAVGSVFGLLTAGANAVPLLVLPTLMATALGGTGLHRFFLAQLVATAAAGLFVFAAAAAVQGVLINVLPYRWFRRASAWMQLAVLFALLAAFFASPGGVATPEGLANPANRWTITLIPSFWFFGLAMAMLGTTIPAALWLAKLALCALGGAIVVAAVSYATGYARYVRRAIEDSGLEPSVRRGDGLVRRLVDACVARTARERAILHFVWRTMTRSRTHRLIFAGYMSVALVYLALGNIGLVEGRGLEKYFRPDASAGSIPLVLSFFALIGMRALFSVPVDLRANWIFRLTEEASPRPVLSAVRKLMFVVAVLPVVLVALPAYSVLWGTGTGARFTAVVLLVLLLVLERLMRDFRKVPFTCSYLPGKSNLKFMFAIYAILFVLFATLVTWMAVGAAGSSRAFVRIALLCGAWLVWMVWRRRSAAGGDTLVYEEKPDWQPVSLELT